MCILILQKRLIFKIFLILKLGMTCPRHYAKDFAKIWKLDFGGVDEPEKELEGYTRTINLDKRSEGEYMEAVSEKLRQILEGSYVTDSCKEFLAEYPKASPIIVFGLQPENFLPLETLGINFSENKYGLFDPGADLKSIESRLLEFFDVLVSDISEFENTLGLENRLFDSGLREIGKRWYEAYTARYG